MTPSNEPEPLSVTLVTCRPDLHPLGCLCVINRINELQATIDQLRAKVSAAHRPTDQHTRIESRRVKMCGCEKPCLAACKCRCHDGSRRVEPLFDVRIGDLRLLHQRQGYAAEIQSVSGHYVVAWIKGDKDEYDIVTVGLRPFDSARVNLDDFLRVVRLGFELLTDAYLRGVED